MKSLTKNLIRLPFYILNFLASLYCLLLNILRNGLGNFWLDNQAEKNRSLKKIISHTKKHQTLKFTIFTPNWLCRYRADIFSTKEPETLVWIDESEGNSVLFDIGANIGLYSLYYALSNKGKVYAFEPSVFNLALLAKNIFENNQQDKIKIITNPLTQSNQFANFTLSSEEEGAALSAFGVEYGHDGQMIEKKLSYQTLGFSLDFLIRNKIITERPNLIKIDVDGIEHLILAGAIETLKHPSCKTVLVEINNSFNQQRELASKILLDCGFIQKEKSKAEIIRESRFKGASNQIWIKYQTKIVG
jgi:FkbM family methyltransferase